jgi:hypothetical protein
MRQTRNRGDTTVIELPTTLDLVVLKRLDTEFHHLAEGILGPMRREVSFPSQNCLQSIVNAREVERLSLAERGGFEQAKGFIAYCESVLPALRQHYSEETMLNAFGQAVKDEHLAKLFDEFGARELGSFWRKARDHHAPKARPAAVTTFKM